jgi:hypothetical protein
MVQAAEMRAVTRKNLAVEIFGLEELPGFMMAYRQREQTRPI